MNRLMFSCRPATRSASSSSGSITSRRPLAAPSPSIDRRHHKESGSRARRRSRAGAQRGRGRPRRSRGRMDTTGYIGGAREGEGNRPQGTARLRSDVVRAVQDDGRVDLERSGNRGGLLTAGYVTVKLDGDIESDLVDKFGVHGYPAGVIVDASGKELGRFSGYQTSAQVLALLRR